jgi:hypothetical protein
MHKVPSILCSQFVMGQKPSVGHGGFTDLSCKSRPVPAYAVSMGATSFQASMPIPDARWGSTQDFIKANLQVIVRRSIPPLPSRGMSSHTSSNDLPVRTKQDKIKNSARGKGHKTSPYTSIHVLG